MFLLKILAAIFLWPGTLTLSALNISLEEDGGILRSFINMIFWGIVGVAIILPVLLRG